MRTQALPLVMHSARCICGWLFVRDMEYHGDGGLLMAACGECGRQMKVRLRVGSAPKMTLRALVVAYAVQAWDDITRRPRE